MATELQDYIDSLPFFDSHSHMAGFDTGTPLDDTQGRGLADILANDYLAYLAPSCDAPIEARKNVHASPEQGEAVFRAILPLLEQCRGLSTYAAYREALRELYSLEGDDLTLENWQELDRQVVATYRKHGERAWQREAMERAGVVKQVHICQLPYVTDHWGELPAQEREAQASVLVPSLVLDGYCFTGFAQNEEMRQRSMEIVGLRPKTYDEHLRFCERVLDRFVHEGGRCVKLLAAYTRTLKFEEVSADVARRRYAKGVELREGEELRLLQDNLVWAVLEMANARSLPLLVHTGYSIPTEWGDPECLLNLVGSARLQGLKIALCHAGWPNEAGAMIMARTFRNCFFDLSWIPLLSPSVARRILAAAIDMVPMNKMMIGTDCGTAECFYGTVKLIRRVLGDVLEQKVLERQFDVRVAKTIAKKILCENAVEFFAEPLRSGPQ